MCVWRQEVYRTLYTFCFILLWFWKYSLKKYFLNSRLICKRAFLPLYLLNIFHNCIKQKHKIKGSHIACGPLRWIPGLGVHNPEFEEYWSVSFIWYFHIPYLELYYLNLSCLSHFPNDAASDKEMVAFSISRGYVPKDTLHGFTKKGNFFWLRKQKTFTKRMILNWVIK